MRSRLEAAWRTVAGFPARLLVLLVRLYQLTLSPIVGRHCRFQPTCSNYFIEAVRTHGALRGGGLGLWRILRCNPLCKGGYDPVPPRQDGPEGCRDHTE